MSSYRPIRSDLFLAQTPARLGFARLCLCDANINEKELNANGAKSQHEENSNLA
jgi:hypothetical protein